MQTKILNIDGNKAFSLLAGINRPILPSQVGKLAESIKQMGIIRPVVVAEIAFITGAPTMYIIDGQHLYHACIRQKVNVPYVQIAVKDHQDLVEKIALLNSSSKSWTMDDYILAWASLKEDYKKLQELTNTYPLSVETIAGVMSDTISGGDRKLLKKGNFAIRKEGYNRAILDKLTEVLDVVNTKNMRLNREICRSFVTFYRSIDEHYVHAEFVAYIRSNQHKVILFSERQEIQKFMFAFKPSTKAQAV
jgi:hypothetical protein